MFLEIVKIAAVLVLLFLGYRLILAATGVESIGSSAIYAPMPEQPMREEFIVEPESVPVFQGTPKQLPIDHIITPAGPGAPSQQAPNGVRHIMAEEQPRDPFAEDQDDAYAPEKMRNPERIYRPAPDNSDTGTAIAGGMAAELSAVPQQMGQFSPEMAQNGGMFMDGIVANNTFDDGNYASY